MKEDLIRVVSYGKYGDGLHIRAGARYEFRKGSETYPDYWIHSTHIIYDSEMQMNHFKKVSEVTIKELDAMNQNLYKL